MLTKTNLRAGVVNNGTHTLGTGSFFTPGNVWYVSSTSGNASNSGKDPVFPLATLAQAQSSATATNGDAVLVFPGHAETVTSALTLSKAGVSYVALGGGTNRATITGNAAIDAINVTGANVTLDGFRFAAPETDDQTADINVAAAGVTIRNTFHIGSQTAKNKTDLITIAAGGDDVLIDGVNAFNTVVDVVAAISLEAAVARPVVRNCNIQGTFSTGVVMDEATSTLGLFENNLFKNTKAATAVVTFTTGNSTGVFRFNHLSGRHTTLANNLVAGTGMDFFENRVVEEAAVNGAILPTADID